VLTTLGSIPIAAYATPVHEGAARARAQIHQGARRDAAVANHGALTVGSDLYGAY